MNDDFVSMFGVIFAVIIAVGGGVYAINHHYNYAEIDGNTYMEIHKWVTERPQLASTVEEAMQDGSLSPKDHTIIRIRYEELVKETRRDQVKEVIKKAAQ